MEKIKVLYHEHQHLAAELVGRVYRPFDSLADLLSGLLHEAVRDTRANGAAISAPGICDISVGKSGEDRAVSSEELKGITSQPWFGNPISTKQVFNGNGRPTPTEDSCRAPIVYQNQEIGCVSFSFDQHAQENGAGAEFLESFAREIAFLVKRHDVGLNARRKLGIDAILIGSSRELRRLEESIEKVAQSELPVVIEAEFGIRELEVAAAIHFCGARKHRPFVVMNCASQQAATFFGELAANLEKSCGGSLLLRFIDELDLAMQKELLALIGPQKSAEGPSSEAGVRIIASASRPLSELVMEGRFYRFLRTEIEVLTVEVPPLRFRKEDIPALLEYELKKHASNPPKRFSQEAVSACRMYDWPENLLELERLVARLAIMTNGDCIGLGDLRQHLGWPVSETNLPGDAGPIPENENDAPGVIAASGLKLEFNENAFPPDPHLLDLARNLIAGRYDGLEKYGVGIERALNYVARNFDHEISLTELAKQSFFSPSHLSFLFKKTLGISFKGILTIVRIEKAKQFLVEKPNHSITEISLDAGFGDLSHFEKTFKRMTGLNPREFRRRKAADRTGEADGVCQGERKEQAMNSIAKNSAGKAVYPKSQAI